VLKQRLIPVVLLRNGRIVQSRRFTRYNVLGDPVPAVERISSWSSDELIYIDITDLDDPYAAPASVSELIPAVAQKCSVPLTWGGGIRTMRDAGLRLRLGADKVAVNTAAIETPEVLTEIASTYGSQCLVVSMDVKLMEDGSYEVYKRGRVPTGCDPVAFARTMEGLGAGELLVNSIDRDGMGKGFDIALTRTVAEAVRIPVIALGGAGSWRDFAEVLEQTHASAVAAANIFHHSENSVYECKSFLFANGHRVRKPAPLAKASSLL